MRQKNILILGAGFGGLRAALVLAKGLKRKKLDQQWAVTLVDRNPHQTYTPLLYEIAATSKATADMVRLHQLATVDIRTLINGLPIKFIEDEVKDLDAPAAVVRLSRTDRLDSDVIVLALGSQANYFNIPGLEKHSLVLKTFGDAIRIRDAIYGKAMEGQKSIRIIVGGAGSSGVELAGELAVWQRELRREFPGLQLDITLIEGQSTILPGFDQRVVKKVSKRLEQLGIRLMTDEKIASVATGSLKLQSGKEGLYDVLVWTGGVKASSLLSKTSLKSEAGGRIDVQGDMECLPEIPNLKITHNIYALGDMVCFHDPKTGKPAAWVARAALQQADIVAHNILEDIMLAENRSKQVRHWQYRSRQYPYIIPVGGKWAVAKLGPFVFSGISGWLLKGLVELNYLISIMPLLRAVGMWLQGLKVFIRNERLG